METADAAIIAMGARAKRLSLEREPEYWQNGINPSALCEGDVPTFRK
jgi:thioredoxin reductase (NADPH)